ncbi:uncharacterized protein LOC119569893 [Penaeus monodon]|uniref:uncharacterized protein LOC119569893 n=1 Tax=Penaeus monodon TaxID=6687 RepID=UPI0018A74939|nr:uncharacterized protein LOC119569893 [Penaeus monodon]
MEGGNTWWNYTNSIILRAGKEILGESSGNKEIWWFNGEVQEKMTKKAVAIAKSEAYDHLYEKLDTEEGQAKIFKYLSGDGELNDQEVAEIAREDVNAALKKMKN